MQVSIPYINLKRTHENISDEYKRGAVTAGEITENFKEKEIEEAKCLQKASKHEIKRQNKD